MLYDESEFELFPSGPDRGGLSGYGDITFLYRGPYADSYRARKGGRYFFLKAARGGNPAFLGMLRREYGMAVGLCHPNIVSVLSFEDVEGIGPCIVMEYVDGLRLSDFLARRPPSGVRHDLLRQLLSAVSYMHMKGVVHNDIKPGNIIVASQGPNLKLVDFGLGDDDANYLARRLGCTPGYASPELVDGHSPVDVRSDVYSLGKIIRLLFPYSYLLVARKCTRRNPGRRYRSAESLARAIMFRRSLYRLLPVLSVLAVALVLLLPRLVSRIEYESAVSCSEALFRDGCRKEGIPCSDIPAISFRSYLEIGDGRKGRMDSLDRMMLAELSDRVVRKRASSALDSLYAEYLGSVEEEGGGCLAREFVLIRDRAIGEMVLDEHKDEFFSFCLRNYHGLCPSPGAAVSPPDCCGESCVSGHLCRMK